MVPSRPENPLSPGLDDDAEDPPPASSGPVRAASPTGERKWVPFFMLTLLIADDEQPIREGIANNIPWRDLQIDTVLRAADGEQALQLARETRIDILLTDMRMPVIDGIRLSRELLKLHPDCVLIFMSAYSDKEYLMSAIHLKAEQFIEKPLEMSLLQNTLAEAVQRCRKREQARLRRILAEKTHQACIPLIRNALALLAINPRQDRQMLLDYLKGDQLGIPIDGTFTTAILQFPLPRPAHATASDRVLLSLETCLSHREVCVLRGVKDEETHILHLFPAREGEDAYRQLPSLLAQWMAQQENQAFFLAVGPPVSGFAQIHRSYACAVSALSTCFFRGYGNLSTYSCSIAHVSLADGEIIRQFSGAIAQDNQEEALTLLKSFSLQLRRMECGDLWEIRNLYSKLAIQLLSALQQYGQTSLDGYETDHALRRKIDGIHTLDELEAFCTGLATSYFQYAQTMQRAGNLDTILRYIHRHYADKALDISRISQHTYLSPSYLCTFFKRATGKTINEYLTAYRLNKSLDWLADKHIPIGDVAGLVGYDGNYFARIFKRKHGVSPSEYRERA